MTFLILVILLIMTTFTSGIDWNGQNWAMSCDFIGKDLTNVQCRGEDCGGICVATPGCTHFTWTNYNGGTCWMKKNAASKNDAVPKYDSGAVCGVNPDAGTGGGGGSGGPRTITFKNRCTEQIWINPFPNSNAPALGFGVTSLSPNSQVTLTIPDAGWGGRFWPKTGCDSNGQSCAVGQSVAPCPPTGCQPPADTKVEFFYPPINDNVNTVWYDVSLVDGYSLPMEIIPSRQQGSCVTTNCATSLNSCPTNENSVGDLRVIQNGRVVQCLAPCKKWNYPTPYGLGQSEQLFTGQQFCCPTPPISAEQCRAGQVIRTQYVNLIHRDCPTAYSYAYDDEAGLHTCPNPTSFNINIC